MSDDFYDVITPPLGNPVTLEEVKEWCKITHSSDDDLLKSLIQAATDKAERITNRVFIERGFAGYFSCLGCSKYETGLYLALRRAPLIDVSEVTMINDGTPVVISPDDYDIKETSGFSRVVFMDVRHYVDYIPYPWRVDFTAGYGGAAAVPEPIKMAIKMAVCYWYSNRGDCSGAEELPGVSKGLLQEYRIVNTYG